MSKLLDRALHVALLLSLTLAFALAATPWRARSPRLCPARTPASAKNPWALR